MNAHKAAVVSFATLTMVLTGCNRQQNVEASNAARNAQNQLSAAAKSAGKSMSDGTITLKVKSAMNASDKLNTSAINVDTKNRVVYLRGAVSDGGQKELADRIATDTVGKDVRVVNELAIGPEIGASAAAEKNASRMR